MPARALYVVLPCLMAAGFLQGPRSAVAQRAIRQAAREALAARFPEAERRVRVRVRRTGGEADQLAHPRVDFHTGTGVPRGLTQVNVMTGSDRTGWEKAGWALLYVAHFDSVAIARGRLPRNARVRLSDLRIAWRETTRFHGTPLRASELRKQVRRGALFTKRPVRAGRPLRRSDVRRPYAARTGEKVVMRYERDGIVFRLPCKARQSGFTGETVRLFSSTTKSMYRARLISAGQATWIETLQ